MFYGTSQGSVNGESSGGEGTVNGTASVDFPEVKKKVCIMFNYSNYNIVLSWVFYALVRINRFVLNCLKYAVQYRGCQ